MIIVPNLLIPTPASPSDPSSDTQSHISPDYPAGTYQAPQDHPELREAPVEHGTVVKLEILAVGDSHPALGAAAVRLALCVSVVL